MGYRLGVDLGTTFTAAAVDDGTGPTMLGLGNRALTVPSVAFLAPDGTFLFGEAADRRAATEPARSAREFKRRIGDTVPILMAGQPFSPQSLSAKLLAWVVSVATERQGSEPDEVVVTYPANWGGYKRELLDQLVNLADVPRSLTCTEPEAAATQYAARAPLAAGDKVAVYDLGGGTFDVCVLEKQDAGFRIVGSPDGVEHLGGIDFDEAVFQHVVGMLGDRIADLDLDDPDVTTGLARLRRECVDAKEALSSDVETTIAVALPGLSTSLRMTRTELEGLITSPLRDTLDATQRALRSADLTPADLTTVVLVGGSSRIPLVSHLLQSEFGVRTAMDTHPKHDIALGAVRYQPPASGETAPAAAPTVAQWPTRGKQTEKPPATPPTPIVAPHPAPTEPEPAIVAQWPTRGRRSEEPTATAAAPSRPPAPAPAIPEPEPATVAAPAQPTEQGPPGPPVWKPPAHGTTPSGDDAASGRRLATRPALIGIGAAALLLVVGASAYAFTRSDLERSGDDGEPEPSPSATTEPSASPTPSVDLPTGPALPESELVVSRHADTGWEMWRGDAVNGRLGRRITKEGWSAEGPVVAADRRTILYVHRADDTSSSLWVVGSDGSGNRELVGSDDPDCPNPSRPAWSTAGSLAIPCHGPQGSFLVLTDPNLHSFKRLRQAPILDAPSFSSDGEKIVYWTSEIPGAKEGVIEVVDASSLKVDRLTDPNMFLAGAPAWSPNGDLIAFRSVQVLPSGSTDDDLFTMRPDGSNPYALTRYPAEDSSPTWSPDGQRIAFVSKRREPDGGGIGSPRVFTMRASDGSDIVRMWPDAARLPEAAPSWSRR